MAQTMYWAEQNPQSAVGHLVYEGYKPMNPGIVIRYVGRRPHPHDPNNPSLGWEIVEVQWKNGTVTQTELENLQDFEFHVVEHKKKYEKFAAMALSWGKTL